MEKGEGWKGGDQEEDVTGPAAPSVPLHLGIGQGHCGEVKGSEGVVGQGSPRKGQGKARSEVVNVRYQAWASI